MVRRVRQKNTRKTMSDKSKSKILKLNSLVAGMKPFVYKWPLISGADKHDRATEIIDTISWVAYDVLPEIESSLSDILFEEVQFKTKNYGLMQQLCERFNKAIKCVKALEKGTSFPVRRYTHPSRGLLRHILQQVYDQAIDDPDILNQYKPFSPEVYGETSYDLICKMIDELKVTSDDVFIDLGSGVGQIVLQMAASTQAKLCLGIEKADVPARFADKMNGLFQTWMAWFGKKYNDYQLIQGDFLTDEHREKINSATIVFVNNFAFGPKLDQQLKTRIADLPDGTRIVSFKSFCRPNFQINDRNLNDIGTIMHLISDISSTGPVSWTGTPVTYYVQVIDRTKLELYFHRLHTERTTNNAVLGTSRNNDRRDLNKVNDEVVGTITRRSWAERELNKKI